MKESTKMWAWSISNLCLAVIGFSDTTSTYPVILAVLNIVASLMCLMAATLLQNEEKRIQNMR